jgi:hypothetical protein
METRQPANRGKNRRNFIIKQPRTPMTTTTAKPPTPGNTRKNFQLTLVLVSGKRETVTYSTRSAAEARTRANNRNEVERVISVEEVRG